MVLKKSNFIKINHSNFKIITLIEYELIKVLKYGFLIIIMLSKRLKDNKEKKADWLNIRKCEINFVHGV